MRLILFSWRKKFGANKRLIIGLMGTAVLLSTLGSWLIIEAQNRDRERAFQEISDTVFERLELTVAGWIALGGSANHLVQLSDGISGENYWQFSKQLIDSYPVLQAVDYMPRVLDSERGAFERNASVEYGSDFTIREFDLAGNLVPAGRRPEYYPVNDARLRGWDIATDPNMGPILERARDDGGPASVIVQSHLEPDEFRIAIVYPIFNSNVSPNDIAESRDSIAAFTLLVLGITNLAERATRDARDEVTVEIVGEVGGQPTLLYSQDLSQRSTPSASRTISVMGTDWSVTTRQLAGVPGRWPDQFPLIASTLLFLVNIVGALAIAIIIIQRKNALAQAENLRELGEAKNQFLSTVSHELRTPLTSVTAFTDVVLRNKEGNLTKTQIEHLSIVQRNSRHLNILIGDLLDVSRVHAGKLQLEIAEFDAREDLVKLVAGLGPIFDAKGQTIRSNIAEANLWLTADQDRLEQVISNLLSNASKYSPVGSEIEFRAEAIGDSLVLTVQDHGIGINSDDLSRLFEPFFRSDNPATRQENGVGLGLFITKGIVEMHRGNIEIESTPDIGTTVTVTIPGLADKPSADYLERHSRLKADGPRRSRLDDLSGPSNA